MKKVFKYLWVTIAFITIAYDAYLHVLISFFGHTSYDLKSEFVVIVWLYMLVTFPIGFLVGIAMSVCSCLIIHSPFAEKGFTFLLMVVNYYFLFIWIPKAAGKRSRKGVTGKGSGDN